MSDEFKGRFNRFLKILIGAGLASFITMITVQYFMGGIKNIEEAVGRSFLIGFGLALLVFVVPQGNKKYPWQ